MKNTMRKFLALSMTMAIMLTGIVNVWAEEVAVEPDATNTYSIKVNNAATTGVPIAGEKFEAYQILEAGTTTSYVLKDAYKLYFEGKITGLTEKSSAPDEYNSAVTNYLNGLNNAQLYALAIDLRTGLLGDSHSIADSPAGSATAQQADANEDEIALISNLPKGWYFVASPDSTTAGLSVAATGAFVALPDSAAGGDTVRINVKQSQPTIQKEIMHDGAWDVVGDSQIGDIVEFHTTSTLPAADFVEKFNTYTYQIADTMSSGLDYRDDVKVYIDTDCTKELDSKYVKPATVEGTSFAITIDIQEMYTNNLAFTNIYTKYSAVLTSAATVATGNDTNEVELKYSNNPYDTEDYGYHRDDVKHFTFEMDITKVNDEGNPLQGAEFGLFEGEGDAMTQINLVLKDGTTYYPAALVEGTAVGTIITDDNGEFKIIGLDDKVVYTLKEIAAPAGYNKADPISVAFTAVYNGTTGDLTELTLDNNIKFSPITSGGDEINSGAKATIMNRLHVYLPSTGGMGTVLFPVVGGGLMLGAAAVLVMSKRKNAAK